MLDTSKIKIRNCLDANGKPAGGSAVVSLRHGGESELGYTASVVNVEFQDGPIIDAGGRNGAFVEDLLYIAQKRIEFYNAAGFRCDENDTALSHIAQAIAAMESRTARRKEAGTEGTHQGS